MAASAPAQGALPSAAPPAQPGAAAPAPAQAADAGPAAAAPAPVQPADAAAAPGGESEEGGDENEIPDLISAGESDYDSDGALWGLPHPLLPDAGGDGGYVGWPPDGHAQQELAWHWGGPAHLGGLHGGNLVRGLSKLLSALRRARDARERADAAPRAVRGPDGLHAAAPQPPRRGRRRRVSKREPRLALPRGAPSFAHHGRLDVCYLAFERTNRSTLLVSAAARRADPSLRTERQA